MFYDQNAVDFLIDRVGWSDAIPPTTLTISSDNLTATSNKHYDEFYKLVTVENVYSAINNPGVISADFNNYLYKLKKEAVSAVLDAVFDNNERANFRLDVYNNRIDISGVDYSSIIMGARSSLFDTSIGYSMATKALELFLSTARMNGDERSNKFNYQLLKGELEGIKNEYAKEVTEGLYSKLSNAINKVIEILFPQNVTPAIIGRHPW